MWHGAQSTGHMPKECRGPMRSAAEPLGIAGLEPADQARVDAANTIYGNMLRIIARCADLGIKWAIENPGNNYLWYHPGLVELLGQGGTFDVEYQTCMVGGARDKWQRVRTNATELVHLGGRWCDRGHEHAPWKSHGHSHTASEAVYPKKLCKRVAQKFTVRPAQHDPAAEATSLASSAMAAAKRPKNK